MLKKLYNWIGTQVHTPYAEPGLALLSFLESLIFPPVAPVLILFCVENRPRAYRYAAIATICSVIGGVVAFYIGFALWETVGQQLVKAITTPETFNQVVTQFKQYQTLAVLIGSFTPVPYKLLGVTAGFCQLSLVGFITYSLIGRAARYFLLALALNYWGVEIKSIIDRWFYQLVLLFVVFVAAGLYLMRI